MVKRQNTPRNRAGKQRSFLLTILSGLGYFIRWLIEWIYRQARKNPLMASGFFLFFLGFSFVSFNALFYQSANHRAVFIQTRPFDNQKQIVTSPTDTSQSTVEQNGKTVISTLSPSVAQNLTSSQPENSRENNQLPENLLETQKKLAALGFYDGPLDGRDGPKTRNAIIRWRESVNNNTNQSSALAKTQDDIASLISDTAPTEETLDTVTTQSLNNQKPVLNDEKNLESPLAKKDPPSNQSNPDDGHFSASIADIMRVQAALRAFGDNNVAVSGKEDENTAEALKNFQKMFSLTVTGKINQEVIDKMKDIGLIG